MPWRQTESKCTNGGNAAGQFEPREDGTVVATGWNKDGQCNVTPGQTSGFLNNRHFRNNRTHRFSGVFVRQLNSTI